jgi:hypothetical protein
MVLSFGLFAKLLSYARNRGCAGADVLVPSAPAIKAKIDFQIRIVPADGTVLLSGKKRGLRYVAVLGSSQSRQSTCQHLCIWGTGTKAQWRVEKLIRS